MARRAHVYPQVALSAADLVDGQVLATPAGIDANDALRLARRRNARVLACGPRRHVLVEDLARADSLGLGDLPAATLARPLPIVAPRTPESAVRRRLAAGEVAVVVDGRIQGLVSSRLAPAPAAAGRLLQRLDPPALEVLSRAGRLASGLGGRAFLVGGLVRDLWRGAAAAAQDLDLVVEGDGLAVARGLADECGGSLVEHERFLTASVHLRDGRRVDVATARTERYETPGALPRVLPGSIAQDLRRRDFTVNALAVGLGGERSELLDPLGGVADLAHRRLRILHPLSFVEDPTRMLRAARYATRLGLRLDAWTVRCRALAVRLAPYPALSAARLARELERLLREPSAVDALAQLVSAGVFRLLDRGWRTAPARDGLAALARTLPWAVGARLAPPLAVTTLALTREQPPHVVAACLTRLAFSGEPRARLERALAVAPEMAARVAAATRPGALATALRETDGLALAAIHMGGDERVRGRVAWYVGHGRRVSPRLGGDEVRALGVPEGPAVAEVLGELRDRRLEGALADRAAEIDYVRSWQSCQERKG